jgi:hypothetical protein
MARIAMLCALACLVVVDGSASAQRSDAAPSCPLGQSVTTDTAGHCCFAGQSWSTSRAACVGAPTCPPTLSVSGTT